MRTNIITTSLVSAIAAAGFAASQSVGKSELTLQRQADTLTFVNITNPTRYLLLPIEEDADEVKVRLDQGRADDTDMDVRLARNKVDCYVPFALQGGAATGNASAGASTARVRIGKLAPDAIGWKKMKLSDTFDSTNIEKFRPVYHHTPVYGWMNDANGLFYKDGEYHLYFQFNPYGSKWGNMHWGHSVSKDLVHWEHRAPAIARDTLGHIFSGSSVVDVNNTSGYGAGTVVSFYTSASDKYGQIQCMAYSHDNGNTFTKYEKNPIITPFDGLKDFRDPKVFWHAPSQKWVMIISADKEMRFYQSKNLKDWSYMSAWGQGYGVQPRQFECPDMVELDVEGQPGKKKWVMIVNVNPGCYFGGSAGQYFVGDFDGTRFVCDSPKKTVKWMDWGKDHYATVCFSNTGSRTIAVPWMSNWQYANLTPTRQFRSANALPRELGLYEQDGEYYVSVRPVPEVMGLAKETRNIDAFAVTPAQAADFEDIKQMEDGTCHIEMTLAADSAQRYGFKMVNDKGELVDIYFDEANSRLVMDRSNSGITDFGQKCVPHSIEIHDRRKTTSVNYINDFALGTWCPTVKAAKHTLSIFVDKSSVEIFLDNGKMSMTNLVFPNEPYSSLSFYTDKGSMKVEGLKVTRF